MTTFATEAAEGLDVDDTPQANSWEEVDFGRLPGDTWKFDPVAATVSGDVLATSPGRDIHCWNGAGWTVVPKPGIPQVQDTDYISTLGGVSCENFFIYDQDQTPGRWHWNGSAWNHTLTGDKLPSKNFQAFAEDDMWDFSSHYNTTTRQWVALANRFDGTTWRDVALPSALAKVQAAGGSTGSNMWIMGPSKEWGTELAYRWNGSNWSQYNLPEDWSSSSIVTVSATEAFAFDHKTADGYLRWDGTRWSRASFGRSLPTGEDYIQGATYSESTLWLSVASHMYRLDNGVWSEDPMPTVSGYKPDTYNVVSDPRTGKLVAGGHVGGETAPRPALLERNG
ncbi:hypothetical protein ACWGH5_37925 [Streptomyces sp. NPDC054864]